MPTSNPITGSHVPAVRSLQRQSWRQDLRTVRTVRFALATTTTLALAQIFNWTVSFAAPALVIALLEIPIAEPSVRDFFTNLGYVVAGVAVGFFFVMLVEPYPLMFVVAYPLVFFLTAYYLQKGASLLLMLMILLTVLIFPIAGNIHEGLTLHLAGAFLITGFVTVVVVQLAFGLLPDPPGSATAPPAPPQAGYSAQAARAAALATIPTAPAMVAFLMFDWASQLVVMLYVGIIALQGSLAHSLYDLKKYVFANLIGGAAALVFYLLIVAVPEFHFFVLLTLLTTLLFGARRFSDAPDAKYFGSALIGMVILISSSLGANADIDTNIVTRLVFISLAGLYVIGTMSIFEPILARRYA
jgi:hypothetical protein